MNVLVKNVPGTADLQPPYPHNTWIEYWEEKSGTRLDVFQKYECPAEGCKNVCTRAELDGCHVQKVVHNTNTIYIVPLCSGCNHRTDYFYVDENLLVPAP